MAVDSEANREATTEDDPKEPVINLHETRPGRKVLTEDGNVDGWIASDLTVEVPR